MTGDQLARAARGEFATWLADVPWGSWATFTYAPTVPGTDRDQNPTVTTARRSMERFLERGTVRAAVWVTERGKRFGRVHNHALIAHFPGGLADPVFDRDEWSRWWRDRVGIVQVEPYDPDRGARGYLGKYLNKAECDWDLWQTCNNSRTQRQSSLNDWSRTSDSIRTWLSGTQRHTSPWSKSRAARRQQSTPGIVIPPRSESYWLGSKRVIPPSSTNPPGSRGISRTLCRDFPER